MNWILLICFEKQGTLVFAEIAVLGSDLNNKKGEKKSKIITYLISKVTKTVILPASQSQYGTFFIPKSSLCVLQNNMFSWNLPKLLSIFIYVWAVRIHWYMWEGIYNFFLNWNPNFPQQNVQQNFFFFNTNVIGLIRKGS